MITVRIFLCTKCWLAIGGPAAERDDTAGCASCAPGTLKACHLVRVAISDPAAQKGSSRAAMRGNGN